MSLQNLKTRTRLVMGDLLDRTLGMLQPLDPSSPSRTLDLSELEERILLSASPMMVLAEMADAAPADSMATELAMVDPSADVSASSSPAENSQAAEQSGSTVATDPSQTATRELVFLDTSVEDYQTLLNDLWENDDTSRDIEVVLLSNSRDGIDQISEALIGRSDIDSIHFVTHGTDRGVKLGSTWLTNDNLAGYAGDLTRWGDALSSNADLVFYGCNLAGGESGLMLLESVQTLTGADIAASTDDTGASVLGGDWDLEVELGSIESTVVFSETAQANWHGLLNTFTVTNTNDAGAGSLRQAILDANSLGGLDTIEFNIGGGGAQTIALTSAALPTISDAVIIDGSTQGGFVAGTPLIEIDGSTLGGSINGLIITAGSSTIRGLMINGFTDDGIDIRTNGGNTIVGNWIGTDGTGSVLAGNADDGIDIQTANNIIGGTTLADRNVITNNASNGITIESASATGNIVIGNYIGLNPDGSSGLGNAGDGVLIQTSAANNIIGGTAAGAGNVISANTGSGVRLEGGATGNRIQGNLIGTAANGTTDRGNTGRGIRIGGVGTDDNLIGGTEAGAGNVIAFNNEVGIRAEDGVRNSFLRNTFIENGDIGIDLGNDGVTSNDSGDGDSGANNLMNFPVLSLAQSTGDGTVGISGTLNSTSNTRFRIEFFVNATNGANIQAEEFLGTITTTTDGSGNADFVGVFYETVNVGEFITATATVDNEDGTYGDTSELAANREVTAIPVITVDTTSETIDGTTTSVSNLQSNRGGDNAISLPEAIEASNATAGIELIEFNIAGSGPHTIAITSALPTITGPVIIDGSTQEDFGSNDNPAVDEVTTGPEIIINADATSNVSGFRIEGNGVTLRSVGVTNTHGTLVDGSGIYVNGDYFSIDDVAVANSGVVGIFVLESSYGSITNTISLNNGLEETLGDGIAIQGPLTDITISGNTLIGNAAFGIDFASGASKNVTVVNNLIKDNGNGGSAQQAGIGIRSGDNHTFRNNTITGSTGDGIVVTNGQTGHFFSQNSIYDNGGLSIDLSNGTALSGDGVTSNDSGDGDPGGNNLQNYPVLTSVTTADGQTTIAGSFNGAANTEFLVEFFSSATADASGHGEARRYLGSTTITTNGSGNATISQLLDTPTGVGAAVTATASADDGAGGYENTSEFAQNVTVTGTSVVTVTTTGDTADGDTSSIEALFADRGADNRISLREAIEATNASTNGATADEIRFDISTSDSGYVDPTPAFSGSDDEYWVISPSSFLGFFSDPVIVDATTQLGYDSGTGRPVIEIDGSGAAGATAIFVLRTNDSTIKGFALHSSADEALEIDGQTGFGDKNTLQGNWVGLDADGVSQGNTEHGIAIAFAAQGNLIGGSGTNEGNVIAGNSFSGIFLRDVGTNDNVIQGNLIGVLPDGTTAAANGNSGIEISTNVSGTLIGGTDSGEGNLIAFNSDDGIALASDAGNGHSILGNTIHSNGGATVGNLGIDIGEDGVSLNDDSASPFDTDGGPNETQNFPTLSTATLDGSDLSISGELKSKASTNYRIEFFNNPLGTEDASGYGEGREYLGSLQVVTGGTGFALISTTLSGVSASANDRLSATVTEITDLAQIGTSDQQAYGNTSEFSQNIAITSTANAAPTVSNLDGDTLNYSEGDRAVVIEQGDDAVVADSDSADFSGGEFTVEIDSGLESDQDVVAIRNQGTGGGQIGISGSDVTYEGTVIGTFSGGTGITPLTVTFNANATPTAVTALVRNVTYENTNTDIPTEGARSVTFDLTDGDGGAVTTQNTTVNVAGVNDDPTNAGSLPTDVTVTEDVSTFIDLSSIDLSDPDHNNQLVTLTLRTSTGGRLFAGDDSDVTVFGSNTGVLTLLGGVNDINTFLNSATRISYIHGTQHTNGDNADTIQVEANDQGNSGTGGGGTAVFGTVNVDITAVNDTPNADASAGAPYSIIEGESLVLDGSSSSDPDGDSLTYEWDLDADGTYDVSGENPTVSWATLQSFGIDDDGSHTVVLRVTDSSAVSDTATFSVTVVNAAPTLTVTGSGIASIGSAYTVTLASSDFGADTITSWTINWGDGTIDTLAGDPTSASHTYSTIHAGRQITVSATDEDGTFLASELLVASSATDEIIRFAPNTAAFIDSFGASSDPLDLPSGVRFGPDGNVYVSGFSSDNILKYNGSTGALIGEFVAPGSGGLSSPGGLEFGPDGNLYVSDTGGDRILRYNGTTGAFIETFISTGSGGLSFPGEIHFYTDGFVYVTSGDTNEILRYNGETGAFDSTFVSAGSGGLRQPRGIAHGADGHLYVGSRLTNEVLRYDGTSGAFVDTFVAAGSGGLVTPRSIRFGADGVLYVGSDGTDEILRYNGTTGAFVDTFVSAGRNGLNNPFFLEFTPQHQVQIVSNVVTVDTTSDVVDGTTTSIAALIGDKGADGVISLREAILATNNTTNVDGSTPDQIHFEIAAALANGAHTIQVGNAADGGNGALPSITDAVIIGGTTAGDFSATPLIELDGTFAGVSSRGLHLNTGSDGSTIRGFAINRFGDDGIHIVSDGNTIAGNFIGLNAAGTAALGIGDDGIHINGGANNVIGGATAADRNIIADSASDGIIIQTSGATGNIIQGNFIGTDITGTVDFGNTGEGIRLLSGAGSTLIGGVNDGEGNLIAFNGGRGVSVEQSVVGSSILRNIIHSNSGLEIDLGRDGVTNNDADDTDPGENNLQNYPVLSSAKTNGSNLLNISGSLTSAASETFRVEFFASSTPDASGFGGAERFLGSVDVTTNSSGAATFSESLAEAVTAGEVVTATATDSAGNTSEFAQNVSAVAANTPPVITLPGPGLNYTENDPATVIDAGATVTDSESANFDGGEFRVGFPGGTGQDGDTLSIRNQGTGAGQIGVSGSTVSYEGVDIGTSSGGTSDTPLVVVLNTAATPAATQALARNVTYENTSDSPATTTRTVRFDVLDGDGGAAMNVNTTVDVMADNDAPVVDLNGSDAVGVDFSDAFSEGSGAVGVTDTDATVSDVDHITYLQLNINLGGFVDGVNEEVRINGEQFDFGVSRVVTTTVGATTINLDFDGSGFTIDNDGGGVIPESDLQDLLRTVQYINNSLNPTDGDRTFSFVVTDAGSRTSSPAVSTVSASGINNRPTLTAFAGAVDSTPEDVEVEITFAEIAAQGNENDVDGTVTAFVVKSVSAGSLKIGLTAESATAYSAGVNNVIDSTLNAYWTPSLNSNGTKNAFTVVARDDLGLESIGNIAVPVDVTAVNDAPTATIVAIGFGLAEDDPSRPIGGASVSDIDAGSNDISATVSVSNGDLTLTTTTGLTFTAGANGTSTLTFEGTVSEINNALATLEYQPDPGFNGSDTLTLFVDDLGNSGGGSETSMDTASITVSAVNDAPLLDLDANDDSGATGNDFVTTFNEGFGPVSVVDDDVSLNDVDNGNLTSIVVSLTNRLNPAIKEALFADASGTPLTVNWDSGPNTLTISGPGTVAEYLIVLSTVQYNNSSTDPNAASRTINFVASDGTDSSLVATTTLLFNAANDPPVIISDGGGATAAIDVAENSTDVTTVTSTDVDGGVPVYSITGADSAKFSIDSGSGILKFLVAPDFESPTDADMNNVYEVTVSVSDQNGGTDTQDITVSVTAVNDNEPIITSNGGGDTATISVVENSVAVTTVTATDDDLPAQDLDYTISGGADAARFSIDTVTGELTFAAAPSFEVATDSDGDNDYDVIVRVSDGISFFELQTITVSVTDVDEFDVSPIIDADGTDDVVNENASVGTSVGIVASATDDDGTNNVVTYSFDGDSNGEFSVDASSGEVRVASGIDRESGATRTITVRATSDDGSFSTSDFTIAINDVDEFDVTAPADIDGTLDAVNENAANGTTVGITASASDADATTNAITYSLFDNAGGRFAIDASTGVVTVAGGTLLDREATASHDITVRAASDDGSASDTTFTIAINDLNDNAPVVGPGQSFSVSEFAADGTALGTATATDVDTVGSIQDWAITFGNADGVFEIDAASGEIRVFNNTLLNFETTANYVLGLTAQDGTNTSASQTVSISVVDENDVPVLVTNAGTSAVEGASVTISASELAVTDEDELPHQIMFSVMSPPAVGHLELIGDPGVTISSFTQDDIDAGRLQYVHDGSEFDDSFTFSVSDGSGGTIATTAFSITNLRVNDAPENSTPTSQTTNEDTPLVFSSGAGNGISVSDVDLNGGLIGIRLVATNGTLTLGATSGLVFAVGNGSNDSDMVFAGLIADVNNALEGLTFAPTADYNGPATVRLISRDMGSSGSGGEKIDDDTINVFVTAVNDNPVAAADEYSTSEDHTLTVAASVGLLANDSDIDGDSLSVTVVNGTANGILSLDPDGSFNYEPNANFNGVDSFTYRASDGSLQSEIQTVALTVSSVNDAPVSNDDRYTIDQLSVLKLDAANGVLVNDLDVEADALQAALVSGPQNGRLVLNADGSLTYTPNAPFFGEDTFTYRSTDGTDAGTIATVRIVVRQTVTSGTSGGDGDAVVEESDTTSNDVTDGVNDGAQVIGTGVSSGVVETSTVATPTVPTTNNQVDGSREDPDTTANTTTELDDGSSNEESVFESVFRIDERGELRDRITGQIVEDAGVVVFTSTDVGSMVYVLEQTGFWTELDTFEQDVKNSILEEGEWEELVVETTTVAGTTLTVGYIVWLLRSGSVVFGLVSSLPAWTMMDPLPVLQSGLDGLGDIDNSDDDSLQGILQAHRDGLETPAESFES